MKDHGRQLKLRIERDVPVALTPEAEQELLGALGDLLLAIAAASEPQTHSEGSASDEHQAQ